MKLRWAKPKIIANFRSGGKSGPFSAFGITRIQNPIDVVYDGLPVALRLWISS
jgi:hypothetical protein